MTKTKTDKRLELVSRQIAELKERIDKDTEKLKKYKAEYDKLTAKKISEFAKSEKLNLTDRFFETLSLVNRMEAEGVDITDLKSFFSDDAAKEQSQTTDDAVKEQPQPITKESAETATTQEDIPDEFI